MIELEKAVLGCLISGSDWMYDRVRREYFTTDAGVALFDYLGSLRREGTVPDMVLCWDDLQKLGLLEMFTACQASPGSLSMFEQYVAEMRRGYVEKSMISLIDRSVAEGGLSADSLSQLRRLIEESEATAASPGVEISECLPAVLEEIEASYGQGPKLPYGIHDLDEITWGAQRGELTIVGAYTGVGKTTLLTALAYNLAKAAHRVLYLCTEISRAQFTKLRLLPLASGVDAGRIRKNMIGPECADEWRALSKAGAALGQLPFVVNDSPSPTVGDIARAIRELKPDVVCVDYIGRCKMPRAENRALQINEFVKGLKNVARNENVSIIAAAQLNRQSQESRAPTLAHLRESGSLEIEADTVVLLHQTDPAMDCIEVIVAKSRWDRSAIVYLHRNPGTLDFGPCPNGRLGCAMPVKPGMRQWR